MQWRPIPGECKHKQQDVEHGYIKTRSEPRPPSNRPKLETFDMLDRNERQAILNNIDDNIESEQHLHDMTCEEPCSFVKSKIAFIKHAKLYHEAFFKAAANGKQGGRKNKKHQLMDDDPHLKKVYDKLGTGASPPMQFLRRDLPGPQGQAEGTWT